jgi:biotin synthase
MSFEDLIEAVRSPDPSREAALELLAQSREPANALKLFAVASDIRDRTIGTRFWWSAGISAMMPCKVAPRCTYCSYFTTESFEANELVAAVKAVEATGIRHLHLSGGSNLKGYDAEMLALVAAIRTASDIGLEINLGPSFSRESVRQFKAMGVRSVTSSLETFNPDVFARTKPGDSLERRKELLEICQDEGMSVRSMILIGLGESEADRIDHLFWLKGLSRLYHLRFSRFQPYDQTPMRDHPRCSPWETARLIAVARLLMPHVDLGLAAGNSHDDVPLWYAAGGGNQLVGALIGLRAGEPPRRPGEEVVKVTDRIWLVNQMETVRHFATGLNREVSCDYPALH